MVFIWIYSFKLNKVKSAILIQNGRQSSLRETRKKHIFSCFSLNSYSISIKLVPNCLSTDHLISHYNNNEKTIQHIDANKWNAIVKHLFVAYSMVYHQHVKCFLKSGLMRYVSCSNSKIPQHFDFFLFIKHNTSNYIIKLVFNLNKTVHRYDSFKVHTQYFIPKNILHLSTIYSFKVHPQRKRVV